MFGSWKTYLMNGKKSVGSSRLAVADNGLRLGEGGDFHQKCGYEALLFVDPQNCHTKH
jgi:hypothetical protein